MKARLLTVFALLAAVACALPCGHAFCTRADIFGLSGYALIGVYIALLAACVVLTDIAHECGHVLAGLCCKMGVKLQKYRPFRSSSVEVHPRGAGHMRLRMLITASGGLLITALVAALGLTALFVPAIHPVCCVLAPYPVYLFIVNAVPAGDNDGSVICGLISRSDSSLVMLAVLAVQGMVAAGTPLKDVPEDMLADLPQLPEDDVYFIILTKLRCEYYAARGDSAAAQKYFERYRQIECYLPSEYRTD